MVAEYRFPDETIEIENAVVVPREGDSISFRGKRYLVKQIIHRVFASRTIQGAGYESIDVVLFEVLDEKH